MAKNAAEPRIGDLVKLKSGGEVMTLAGTNPAAKASGTALWRCVWHAKDGAFQSADIHPDCLARFSASNASTPSPT